MSELSQIAPRENQALKKFTLFLFSFVLAFAFPIVSNQNRGTGKPRFFLDT